MGNYTTTEDIDYEIVAEPEVALSINKQLNLARRLAEETYCNVFLTGKAGTGKTTFLRNLCKDSDKRIVVLAPTGVAAINAGGVTINSFFQFPLSIFIPGKGFAEEKKFNKFSSAKLKLIKSLDMLVIDEISMVRPDMLDAIDDTLRRVRRVQMPFGGVQLLMIGDLRQLSPVIRETEWALMSNYYRSPYFFDSKALNEAGYLAVELTEVFRQTDKEFISLLNGVRDASITGEMLETLNKRYHPDFQPDEREGYIRLTTHNHLADTINERQINTIAAPMRRFNATVTGNFPTNAYPADEDLCLKEGAQVMFIKNDVGEDRKYYNGMVGKVISIEEEYVVVRPMNSNRDINVGSVEWENTRYELDDETGNITQIVDGVFSQIPLRLAWAITIHKSQGLTFEHAIIDAQRSFAPGQAYVALSRCKTLGGMVLGAPISRSAIITDPQITSFESQCRQLQPTEETIEAQKRNAYNRAFAEMFDFNALYRTCMDFKRVVMEYLEPFHHDLYEPYKKMEQDFRDKIRNVGDKFIRLYGAYPEQVDADTESQRKKKIQGGCDYFADMLNDVYILVSNTPNDVDNKETYKRIERVKTEALSDLYIKGYLLRAMSKVDFSVIQYQRARALAIIEEEKHHANILKNTTNHRKRSKQEKEKKEKKPKGYSQMITLEYFQKGMTIKEIAEARSLVPATIAGHLAELTNLGRIAPQEVLSTEVYEKLEKIWGETPDNSSFFNRCNGKFTNEDVRYFFKIQQPKTIDLEKS